VPNDQERAAGCSRLQRPGDRGPFRPGRHGNARDQHLAAVAAQIAISLNVTSAAVTSAITVFLAVFGIGQLLVGPLSDRYGRRWPVLIGFAVFFGGSVWCGLATDLPNLLVGRVVQAAGACATSVLSRAIARDMFSGPALARAMALIMIVMSAAPGFSPLLGGALDHSFGWRSEFALVAAFAAAGAIAYGIILGETHNSIRTPLNLVAIARTYVGLLAIVVSLSRLHREPDHRRLVLHVFGCTATIH
jgi:Arabinose efflux permease